MTMQITEKQLKSQYLTAILGAFAVFFLLEYTNIAERINFAIYDSLQLQISSSDSIAVIKIDDKSLNKIGSWPWSRSVHAQLLTKLNRINPQAVAFDLLFTDTDSRNNEGDSQFSQAIKNNGKVILPVLQAFNNTISLQYPIAALKNAAARLAHVDAEIDSDGLIRRVFLKAGINNSNLSALGLAALETAYPENTPFLPSQAFQPATIPGKKVWVRNNLILLPSSQIKNNINSYSYIDILENEALLKKLENKIIFIGVTASGISNNLPIASNKDHSPVSSVFYHASVANALLSNKAIIPASIYLNYFIGATLLFLLFFIYNYHKPGISLTATFLFSFVTLIISWLSLSHINLWIPPAETIIAILISYPLYGWRHIILMKKQLSREKQRAEVTLQSIADGVITLDQNGTVLYMNPIAEQLTGESLVSAKKQNIERVFNVIEQPSGKPLTFALLKQFLQKDRLSAKDQHLLINKHGQKYTIRITVGEIKHAPVIESGIVLAFSDITETTNLLNYMSHQATHDSLTNLPNRASLMESLIHYLAVASRNQYQIALLFIDIDKFKNVNDGFGHKMGDQLLTKIAKRLKDNVRNIDTVARLGGDEFVIVLDQIHNQQDVAKVSRKITASFEKPISLDKHKFSVTCSIGISFFPTDASNAETLLKNADIAMYSAKAHGRNNFQYFSKNMNDIIQGRLSLEKQLRIALEKNQLQLFYQPQVNLHNNKIIGVEALLRWNTDKLGNISPSHFIPLAEDTGLIVPIGEWVFHTACKQLRNWKYMIDDDFTLAVNLSPRQFLNQNILQMLEDTIREESVNVKNIKLEITEGLFVSEKNNIESTLEAFRAMGGSVSIDDFGTGYSSLGYLNRIPVDQVKIDRSFVKKICQNSRSRSLTKAIISMANDMNLDVIAEGVEQLEQLNILKTQNCHLAQGFYYSPAVKAKDITKILRGKQSVFLSQQE